MNPILMIPLAFAATLLLDAGPTQAQQQPTPLPSSVAAYNRAVAEDKVTIESLFDLGLQAASDLLQRDAWPRWDPDAKPAADHPDPDKELAVLAKQMPGFALAIGE